MRIMQVEIENFRGIEKGVVRLPPHALLLGPNSAGKSTVLEALDLVLGPERAQGRGAIDEHDFYWSTYRSASPGTPPPEIVITVVLGSLADEERTRNRAHLEPWNAAEHRVLTADELAATSPLADDYVLRVQFRAWYDADEDEFRTETVYLHPPDGNADDRKPFGRRQKQAIGFLFLRPMRTARRAASLQRGSLLDTLFRERVGAANGASQLLDMLQVAGYGLSQNAPIAAVLKEIDEAMGTYIARDSSTPSGQLNVTDLTREGLRTTLSYFLATRGSDHLLPFERIGGGATNILVLALLKLIAKKKSNVIFAMEEPEIALGPAIQRRIVADLKELATQAILTSHSPYVAEQMLPDQIIVLSRESPGELRSLAAKPVGTLKEKALRKDFRLRFAEGLVGNAVVVVEGVTETYALPVVSELLASVQGTAYRSLDASGIVPVDAGGDGDLEKVAAFFNAAGIDTFVFSDTLKDRTLVPKIQGACRDFREHPYNSFEALIAEETPLSALERLLPKLKGRHDYPQHIALPNSGAAEADWRQVAYDVLEKRKAEGYAALLLGDLTPDEIPKSLGRYLRRLHEKAWGALPPADPLATMFTSP